MSLATSPYFVTAQDESLRWQERGACSDVDTDVFYVGPERGPTLVALEARAKTICASCPVIQQCREYALRNREPYGIWGGLTPKERARTDLRG